MLYLVKERDDVYRIKTGVPADAYLILPEKLENTGRVELIKEMVQRRDYSFDNEWCYFVKRDGRELIIVMTEGVIQFIADKYKGMEGRDILFGIAELI